MKLANYEMEEAFAGGDWRTVIRLMSDHFGLDITSIQVTVKRPLTFPGLQQSFVQMPGMRAYWWDNDEGFYEEPDSYVDTVEPRGMIYCPLALGLELAIKL